jgi:thioester reductase-like protein
LTYERLGLSDEHRKHVVENCHIIINSAASVNFDDPLKEALQINYFGCMRMLELAQECKQLEIFTHVSTCYVNCTIPGGPVEEKVYNVENNAEKIVKRIMAMNPQEVADNEKDLIGKFPNTYTFTKSLAE